MAESGWPLSISSSFVNTDEEVKVCDICGDAGFDDLLAICSQCNEGAEHVYCMQTLLDTVPPNWICEECKLKGSQDKLASVDLQENISTQTSSNETGKRDLPGSASKAFSDKKESVKDLPVPFLSDQVAAGSAAEHTVSMKQVCESTGKSRAHCSMSVNTNGRKSKELTPSGVELNGSSSRSAPLGSQSLNDTQGVKTSMHVSEINCSKQTSLQPGVNLKGSHNSAETGSLNNTSSPPKKLAPSPRPVLSKSGSAKAGGEMLSFLLPSRPKELTRSSSGTSRVASVGSSFKTSKMPNQTSNTGNASGKGNGQHISISDLKIIVAPKLESFDKMDSVRSKWSGSCPVPLTHIKCQQKIGSLPDTGSFQDFQGVPEDSTVEAGVGNKVASKVSNASGCMEWKSMSSVRTPCCYKCKEMGHSAEMCSSANLRAFFDPTAGGPQGSFKNNMSVCFDDVRSVVSKPVAPVQPNKVVHISKGDLLEGAKEWKQGKEVWRSESNSEERGLDSSKTVNSINSKLLPKRTCSIENEKPSFQAQGVESKKMEIVTSSSPAYPVPLPSLSQNGTSSHVGNSTPRQFKPVNSGPSVRGRNQTRPRSYPPLQSVQGIHTPAQPSCIQKATAALCSHHKKMFPEEVRAIPDAAILWQGRLKVASSTGSITYYSGMQAHASNRADPKVFKAANELPAELQVEELQRGMQNDSWPRSFQGCPPASNSIGIFFFPEDMESHDTFYKPLLDRMIVYDLTLRVNMEFAQLLIFPSHLLPEAEQRWNDMTYLWGVFRAKKGNSIPMIMENLHPELTTPSVPLLDRDGGNQRTSPSSVGEVIDMDIDMEGGKDVGKGQKSQDRDHRESETHDIHLNSPFPALLPSAPSPPVPPGTPFPPLPPGTPPAQPSPPPTPSRLQQGDSPELLSGVSKHVLPIEDEMYAMNAPVQSRHGHKEQPLALGHSSSSPEPHQDGISILRNLHAYTSKDDVIHINGCVSKATVQTAGEVLLGVNLKDPPQQSKLTSTKSGVLVCSIPSELHRNGDGALATLTEKGVCQQLESRSCLSSGGAHIFHVEDISSYESAQVDCRENRDALHFNQKVTEACGGMDFDRSKRCFRTNVRDRRKTKVDGHDELKENKHHFGQKSQKQYGTGPEIQPHCSETSLRFISSRILHSGARSCSLSASPPLSPMRSEISGNAMLMKETNLVRKCHGRHNSPSSSESLATESVQTLSRSGMSPNDLSHNDEACILPEMSEKIGSTFVLQRTATSNGFLGQEKTIKGLQCNPGFWESTSMASQRIGTRTHKQEQFHPCLHLFPMGELSTEYDMTEGSDDCEVDQAGGCEQRNLVTQSMPLVEQLERRPISSSSVDMETDSPRKLAPEQGGNGLLIGDPELTLSMPRYRKQGNAWSRVEDELISFCGDDINLCLSLL